MRKIILCAIAVCAMLISGQKAAMAQFMIGIGYDQSQYTLGGADNGNPFDGFSAEVSHTMGLIGNAVDINFGVGYQFNTRSDESYSLLGLGANVSSQEQYVTVPLRLVVLIPVSTSAIMLFAGGYGAYALSGMKTYEFMVEGEGRSVITYDYLNDVLSSDVVIPGGIVSDVSAKLNGNTLTKLDYGVQGGGGIRFGSSVMFSAMYNYGLAERNSDVSLGNRRRKGLSFKVSFLF